jgi:4a-hydroxytetrahydrobiopterin dehydratase
MVLGDYNSAAFAEGYSVSRGEQPMLAPTEELKKKRCLPCEGGVPPVSEAEARKALESLREWKLSADGKRIRREWRVKDFAAGLEFFEKVGALADDEGHHPDLHLTGYRDASIELTTHAIGGLSENDFILAAKIDEVPVQLKSGAP